MKNIFWEGFSDNERYAAIENIVSAISKHGDVIDIHFFSDIALSMTIEVKEYRIDELHNELTKIISVLPAELINSISKKERTIYLNITFTKGKGKLKIEAPSVLG